MQGTNVRYLVCFIILATSCIGIQLTPRPPSIELTSLIVFLTSAVFGLVFGVGLGTLVMCINGFVSPWGVAGLLLPFQVIGAALIGVGGASYRRSRRGSYDSTSCVETAILGAFLTLVYDIITNFGWSVYLMLMGQSFFLAFLSALFLGVAFSIVHVVSNTILFGAAFVPLANVLQKLLGGGQIWKKDFSHT